MGRLIATLIRHGDYQQLADAPSAHQPFPLTPLGEQQAGSGGVALAAELRRRDWTLHPVIDSSQLLRAWQTADIIAGQQSPRPVVQAFDTLAERSVGLVGNLTVGQIERLLREDPRYQVAPPGWKADGHYCLPFPGAESLHQAGERVAAHIERRMATLSRTVADVQVKVFVGHGAAFRHAACHLGVLVSAQIAALSMYHVQPIYLERLPDGRWRQLAGEWKQRQAGEVLRD